MELWTGSWWYDLYHFVTYAIHLQTNSGHASSDSILVSRIPEFLLLTHTPDNGDQVQFVVAYAPEGDAEGILNTRNIQYQG